MTKINKKRFESIVTNARDQQILVFGDLMVDEYLWGDVSRISPEAPVPIINISSAQTRFGGAANVAYNLLGLGQKPLLIGAVGDDRMGGQFIRMMEEHKLSTDGILVLKGRPTTVKTRIIGNNQHIARVDQEITVPVSPEIQEKFFQIFIDKIESSGAVILQDYNKGVVVPPLISHLIDLANRNRIPITVDPKFENFLEFKNVTVFKPNIKETEEALVMRIRDEETVSKAGQKLLSLLNSEAVLITRGSRGMALFERNGNKISVETRARRIADVSGAGDTVIATLTYALSGGANIQEAVMLANYAAGLVCEEVGVVPVHLQKLKEAILDPHLDNS